MKWIRRLFARRETPAPDPMPVLPDPLAEKFDDLEREVRRREWVELQARCEHEQTHVLLTIGLPPETICALCGKVLAP